MDTPDPSQLRISDQDRHQVAEVLREAAGEGRIDLDELDERLDATYAARTYADLVPITLDLPATPATRLPDRPAAPTPSPVVPGPAEERHLAILGGLDRKGVWVVPQHLPVVAFMGGADLDLRQAQFAAREVTITINAVMGGADIKVNPHDPRDHGGRSGSWAATPARPTASPAELDAEQPRRPDPGLRDHGRRERRAASPRRESRREAARRRSD